MKLKKKNLIFTIKGYVIGKKRLNFEHRCCFPEQLNYKGFRNGSGELVEVPMESGKIGIYKVTSERYNTIFDYTGQRNFFFKFIKYKFPLKKII